MTTCNSPACEDVREALLARVDFLQTEVGDLREALNEMAERLHSAARLLHGVYSAIFVELPPDDRRRVEGTALWLSDDAPIPVEGDSGAAE